MNDNAQPPESKSEPAYIHKEKYQVSPDNLFDGIESSFIQIGHGITEPPRGVIGGIKKIGTGIGTLTIFYIF